MLCDLKDEKLVISIDTDVKIRCDYKWIVEALNNIVKNCIEHSKKKGIVKIESNSNKLYTEVMVKDSGSGIDKNDLPHIFESFYKGKNATSDGVGIGLALSKSIIEKDNGKVRVESSENSTTFIIKSFK